MIIISYRTSYWYLTSTGTDSGSGYYTPTFLCSTPVLFFIILYSLKAVFVTKIIYGPVVYTINRVLIFV